MDDARLRRPHDRRPARPGRNAAAAVPALAQRLDLNVLDRKRASQDVRLDAGALCRRQGAADLSRRDQAAHDSKEGTPGKLSLRANGCPKSCTNPQMNLILSHSPQAEQVERVGESVEDRCPNP